MNWRFVPFLVGWQKPGQPHPVDVVVARVPVRDALAPPVDQVVDRGRVAQWCMHPIECRRTPLTTGTQGPDGRAGRQRPAQVTVDG